MNYLLLTLSLLNPTSHLTHPPLILPQEIVCRQLPNASAVAYVTADNYSASVLCIISRDPASIRSFSKRAIGVAKRDGVKGCVKVVVYTFNDVKPGVYTRRGSLCETL